MASALVCRVPKCEDACVNFTASDDNKHICLCGHKINQHSPDMSQVSTAGEEEDDDDVELDTLSGWTTNSQGHIFEGEVVTYLNNFFDGVCKDTKADVEYFESRAFGDFSQSDLDLFSYAVNDAGGALKSIPGLGFVVLEEQKEMPATPDAKLKVEDNVPSPHWEKDYGAPSKKLSQPPTKYIVGEAYSGQKEGKIGEKLTQLEKRLMRLRMRFEDRTRVKDSDITDSVFATVLAIRSQTSITPEMIQRRVQLDSSLKFIRRMILARRFVVLTVPINSYPLTILAMAQAKQGQAQAKQAKQQAQAQAQQAKAQAQQAKQTNKLSSRLASIEEGIERILGGRDVHKRASVHRSWNCSVCNQDTVDFSRNQLKKGILRKCRRCIDE